MKKTICVLALLIVLALLTATALSFAEGNELFPKTYELSLSDIERYQNIMQAIVGKEPSWLRHGSMSLEEKVQIDMEIFGEDRSAGGFIHGVPTEADMPREQALFFAYAAMEDKYGYNEDILCLFYPDYSFNVADENDPLWQVGLHPQDGIDGGYMDYFICVHARSGVVESCFGPEDASG